jgi:hypothetical protein
MPAPIVAAALFTAARTAPVWGPIVARVVQRYGSHAVQLAQTRGPAIVQQGRIMLSNGTGPLQSNFCAFLHNGAHYALRRTPGGGAMLIRLDRVSNAPAAIPQEIIKELQSAVPQAKVISRPLEGVTRVKGWSFDWLAKMLDDLYREFMQSGRVPSGH